MLLFFSPSVLVSDILWDNDESYTSTSSQHLLKKEDPDTLGMPFLFSFLFSE
jgi:hypothetical protein